MNDNQHELAAKLSREQVYSLFNAFIRQRPGFDYANYGDATSYNADVRVAGKDRREALNLLEVFAVLEYTPTLLADIMERERLQLEVYDGRIALEYCAGQYWPTEYRAAAVRVLRAYNYRAALKPNRESPETNEAAAKIDALHAQIKAIRDYDAEKEARSTITAAALADLCYEVVTSYDPIFEDTLIVPVASEAEAVAVVRYMQSRNDQKKIRRVKTYDTAALRRVTTGDYQIMTDWRYNATNP